MQLIAIAPWTSVDEVRADVEFDLLVADDLATLDPPTEEELAVLRAEVDPTGRTIAGDWITLEDGGLRRTDSSPAAATP
jgi:hypothetical protein